MIESIQQKKWPPAMNGLLAYTAGNERWHSKNSNSKGKNNISDIFIAAHYGEMRTQMPKQSIHR